MPHDRKPVSKRKRKVQVKFDEKARNEYLTGFRKRKQERKLKAQNDIERKLKQKVREERNKKRKAEKAKREEILKGVTGLLDNLENEVTESYTEKVDFADHEVFVKTDVNFADSGFIGNNGGVHDNEEGKVVRKEESAIRERPQNNKNKNIRKNLAKKKKITMMKKKLKKKK